VERNRGRHHGYTATAGTKIPSLVGADRSVVFESVAYRTDPLTGRRERRLDIGFLQDGLCASSIATWRGKILSEFILEVFILHYISLLIFINL
jgi:hypothetical protein